MANLQSDVEAVWSVHRGDGPLIATAIHDGHALRPEVAALMGLDELQRRREEDPFTGGWADVAPTRVIGLRSRFEVDLNRPREGAVYRKPEDAWGLHVWKRPPGDDLVERSLSQYDDFYRAMRQLLAEFERQHGPFVVYDLHTYNHRRDGPDGAEAETTGNPQVNIGTGTMDRSRWGPIVDRLLEDLRAFDFPGGKLDVRENVKFKGGNWPRWIHETFPRSGVAIAIEFKKFFMDEWSGKPTAELVAAIGEALRSTIDGVLDELRRL